MLVLRSAAYFFISLLVSGALLSPVPACAQSTLGSSPAAQPPADSRGRTTLGFSILMNFMGRSQEDDDGERSGRTDYNLGGDVQLGQFVTDSLELAGTVRGNLQWNNSDDRNSGALSYLAALKMHFNPYGDVDPYVGVQAGATSRYISESSDLGGESDNSLETNPSAGARGGINFFLSENTSFFNEINFLYTSEDVYDVFDTSLRFGFSYYF